MRPLVKTFENVKFGCNFEPPVQAWLTFCKYYCGVNMCDTSVIHRNGVIHRFLYVLGTISHKTILPRDI